MKKFKLHQKGVKALQQLLHDLPDSKLAIEVMALRINFRQWVKSKFDLTYDELEFIDQLNRHFIEYLAIESSNFLAQRKAIRFTAIEFKPVLTETETPTQIIST